MFLNFISFSFLQKALKCIAEKSLKHRKAIQALLPMHFSDKELKRYIAKGEKVVINEIKMLFQTR